MPRPKKVEGKRSLLGGLETTRHHEHPMKPKEPKESEDSVGPKAKKERRPTNKLKGPDYLALYKWFIEVPEGHTHQRVEQFKAKDEPYDKVAEIAQKELGFTVTDNNVLGLLEDADLHYRVSGRIGAAKPDKQQLKDQLALVGHRVAEHDEVLLALAEDLRSLRGALGEAETGSVVLDYIKARRADQPLLAKEASDAGKAS